MKFPTIATVALFLGAATFSAIAHEGEHFSAGVPGNPKKPARTVTVVMSDDNGMKFTPDHLDVKKGEQVHFIIQNKGALKHEFMLASVADNDKHAKLMHEISRHGARRPERQERRPRQERGNPLALQQRRHVRIRLPDPRPPRGRHARHRHREMKPQEPKR